MTDDDYDALSQKQLASIKRDMRISLEDAAVRATHKVMAELQRTWVGLTEPERLACYDLNPARFASAIEAKLKEKNVQR